MKALPYVSPLAALIACVANAAELPPDLRQEAMAIAAICRPDAQRDCADVRPGGGRILACLAARPHLSPACAAALPRAQALMEEAKRTGQ